MSKIKFIPQPYNSKLCGQTCLSMITKESIEDICKDIGKDWDTDVFLDWMPYLNRKGYRTRIIHGKDISFNEVPNGSIIRITRINNTSHAILKHNDKYYDPLIGIIDEFLNHDKITHYLTFNKIPHEIKSRVLS